MATLSAIIRRKKKGSRESLWKGPEVDGVTYSLLSRFLCCRERFRIMVVEGLKPADKFYAPVVYGNLWHACEEALAAGTPWQDALGKQKERLYQAYPLHREEIIHWCMIASIQFPHYLEYWEKNKSNAILREAVFNVPYKLPSGRVIRLRGKWDRVNTGVYIQENKTKSRIDLDKLSRQLTFDLQSMLYQIAYEIQTGTKVKGTLYNVVRRPAHKTPQSFQEKIANDLANGRGGEWFARLKVEVTRQDVLKFQRECLDPLLEFLCLWWDGLPKDKSFYNSPYHWRHPFGVYNILDEGGSSDLDHYLHTGSESGLVRVDTLFQELE